MFVVGRIMERSGSGAAVCFISCAIPLFVVCVGWLPEHQGPSQTRTQTVMCQFYYSHCCLTQRGKAALFLRLALILLPTKYVFGIHRLACCSLSFSHSVSLPASLSLTLTCFFSICSFICVTQPLSISISASVSCFD